MSFVALNPTTGDTLREYPETSPESAKGAIDRADAAQRRWRLVALEQRTVLLSKAADLLRKRKTKYATRITREMGKLLTESEAEVEKCAWVCDYFAERAGDFLKPESIPTEAIKSYIHYEPLGCVLAVMPWNFPFWQVFRFAAPALMAGNAAILKHASNVPGSALDIEEVFVDSGFPEGLFQSLLVGSSGVGALVGHPAIKAVTLTGSTPAGRAIASKAGEMLKKSVLELGGSDAYVILEDAELREASEICVKSRMMNAGQSCISAKRFIVVASVLEEFQSLFVEGMRAHKAGDPLEKKTTLAPLARDDLRRQLQRQVQASVDKGAKILLGGSIPAGRGFYYPATVLADVRPGMPAFDEELFGPVAAIIAASDEKEAVELANRSSFGLGAAVFTRDRDRGERIAAHELEAGSCFVNALVASDPRLPFGGIKESGYGRELAHFGIREFCNIKTVVVR